MHEEAKRGRLQVTRTVKEENRLFDSGAKADD